MSNDGFSLAVGLSQRLWCVMKKLNKRKTTVAIAVVVFGAVLFCQRSVWLHQYGRAGSPDEETKSKIMRNLDLFQQDIQDPHKVSLKKIAARFEQRRQQLRRACLQLNGSSKMYATYPRLKHAIERFTFPTNTSLTVLYCSVPKAGSTFLMQTFAALNNRSKVLWNERFYVRPVEDYDKATMFLFTREPYGRMLSAYVDKLWSPNMPYWTNLGAAVIQTIRPKSDSITATNCTGHDVTFAEFVKYFIAFATKGIGLDPHLIPTSRFCESCKYHYDFIGKMETFREDAAFILAAINVTSAPDLSNDNDVIAAHVKQAFYAITVDRCQSISKREKLLRMWRALQIQGYISFTLRFPFTAQETAALEKTDMLLAIHQAVERTNHFFKTQQAVSENVQSHSSNEHEVSENIQSRATTKDEVSIIIQSQSATLSAHRGVVRVRDSARTAHHVDQTETVLVRSKPEQKRLALCSAYHLVQLSDKRKLLDLLFEEFRYFGYKPFNDDVFAPESVLYPNMFNLSDI